MEGKGIFEIIEIEQKDDWLTHYKGKKKISFKIKQKDKEVKGTQWMQVNIRNHFEHHYKIGSNIVIKCNEKEISDTEYFQEEHQNGLFEMMKDDSRTSIIINMMEGKKHQWTKKKSMNTKNG
jgi:hypothetical protein